MKTNLLLLGMNRLVFRPRPDKTFYKVLKRTELWLFCLIAFFFSLMFHSKISLECFASINIVFCFSLLLCFLLWQRVVKADIVNYSQEPVTRTVNPPRSSMCAVQWPYYFPLVWYLWLFSYLDTGSGISRNF